LPEIIIPKWEDFRNIVRNANTSLIICCPYYTETGVDNIFDNLRDETSLSFLTRLSPSDWVNGVSDPEALVILLELLEEAGRNVTLQIHQRLHAKVYIADRAIALIGSSNLSEGGFGRNIEMMVKLLDTDAEQAWNVFDHQLQSKSRNLAISQLRSWVNAYSNTIKNVRSTRESSEADELENSQKELDILLGYGQEAQEITEPRNSDLTDFVTWLRTNSDLSGADVLLARYDNSDNQNLTGHFRQCFFAVVRFQKERTELQRLLSQACDQLLPTDLYQLSSEISDAWIEHIDTHATDSGTGYSYSVLRGILPPSLGGTRLGGGGGSSTLKRMLPLVGKFIEGIQQ